MPYDINVYVLHSPETCGVRRQTYEQLGKALESKGAFRRVNVEMVNSHEPSELVARPSMAGLVELSASGLAGTPEADMAPLMCKLHVNQLSCTLKHAAAWRLIAQRAGEGGFHVVLEDDCLFQASGVDEQLLRSLKALPSDYDVGFLGSPLRKADKVVSTVDIDVERLSLGSGACLLSCESYVMNPLCAQALVQGGHALPVRFSHELQLTFLIRRAGLRAYMLLPNVFLDGSKLGVYISQQNPASRLIWNEGFLRLEQLVGSLSKDGGADGKQVTLAKEALEAAQKFVDGLQFKGHPDMLRLLAKLQHRLGNLKEAEILYRQAYELTLSEKCLLTSASPLLRDYMVLYRQLQDV